MCSHSASWSEKQISEALFLLLFKTCTSEQEIYLGNLSSLLPLSGLEMILQNGVYMISI